MPNLIYRPSAISPYGEHPVSARDQFGLTLVEVLVTIFILSFGLLGLAGLQMTGLKSNRNALYQTVSAQLVESMAEQILADPRGANGTQYDSMTQSADSSQCSAANPSLVTISACIASTLPGGTARVTKRSDTPKTFYVAVTWADVQLGPAYGWSDDRPNGTPPSYATSACGSPVVGSNCHYAVIAAPPS